MFTYCTQVLHLSEHAAYGRIEAARAARRFPILMESLESGALTLTTVALIAPHLTLENHRDVIERAKHKSKREVEHIVAALRPQPAVPSTVRKLPDPKPMPVSHPASGKALADQSTRRYEAPIPASAPVTSPRPAATPLAPERYRVQFTVSRDTYHKLRRAQDLLRHAIPNGDPAVIFDRALTVLLAHAERAKYGATNRPRFSSATDSKTRHIAAAVRRKVWERDDGRCAFVGSTGRCTERGFLEFHHVVPYADGGAGTADSLELRCRAHNMYEAERWDGVVRETSSPFLNSVRTDSAISGAATSV